MIAEADPLLTEDEILSLFSDGKDIYSHHDSDIALNSILPSELVPTVVPIMEEKKLSPQKSTTKSKADYRKRRTEKERERARKLSATYKRLAELLATEGLPKPNTKEESVKMATELLTKLSALPVALPPSDVAPYANPRLMAAGNRLSAEGARIELSPFATPETDLNYEFVFQQGCCGMMVVDIGSGLIVDANQVCCRTLGYAHSELTSLTMFDLHTSKDCGIFAGFMLKLQSDPTISSAQVTGSCVTKSKQPVASRCFFTVYRQPDGTPSHLLFEGVLLAQMPLDQGMDALYATPPPVAIAANGDAAASSDSNACTITSASACFLTGGIGDASGSGSGGGDCKRRRASLGPGRVERAEGTTGAGGGGGGGGGVEEAGVVELQYELTELRLT